MASYKVIHRSVVIKKSWQWILYGSVGLWRLPSRSKKTTRECQHLWRCCVSRKKCFKILQELALSYLETLKIMGKSQKILKRPPTWISFVCWPRVTKVCLKFQVGQWFQTGTPMEKVSEFWDSELKLFIQESWSYIKDSDDFIKNWKTSIISHRMQWW